MTLQAGNANLNLIDGPEEGGLDGLQVTERKRLRGGPDNYEVMDTEGRLNYPTIQAHILLNTDAVLSGTECAISSTSEMTKLANQASQQP